MHTLRTIEHPLRTTAGEELNGAEWVNGGGGDCDRSKVSSRVHSEEYRVVQYTNELQEKVKNHSDSC